MARPRQIIAADGAAAARLAADEIEDLIRQHPHACLALPTGRTPIRVYQELADRYQAGRLDFAAVRTFNLDEWVGLAPSAPGSYAMFMAQYLFSKVNFRSENCHIPNGLAPDLARECDQYEECLRLAGGIDLALLGIGRNGHIGFNEPGTPFDARTHVAAVAPLTRESNAYAFAGAPVPERALTMGIATILAARAIILLAIGSNKAEILHRALRGPVTPDVPASALQRHPNVLIIADTSAAQQLLRPAARDGAPE